MKTICPHCSQEYDDLPDDYLNQTVTCTSCQKDFAVAKVLTPLEKAEMFARTKQKKERRRKIIKRSFIAIVLLIVSMFIPSGYAEFIYYKDCKALRKYQNTKAEKYTTAFKEMKRLILEAKSNRLRGNASKDEKARNIKQFAEKYNVPVPDLGLPVLDDDIVESLLVQAVFSATFPDAYETLLQTGWWRKKLKVN